MGLRAWGRVQGGGGGEGGEGYYRKGSYAGLATPGELAQSCRLEKCYDNAS